MGLDEAGYDVRKFDFFVGASPQEKQLRLNSATKLHVNLREIASS